MVKISVIIPAYNIEEYIQRCINSIISQNLKDVEIIVINDGSTDKTREKVDEIAKLDSRIRLINVNNGGVSKARNKGIEEANGEYLMFVDGDDWIDTNTLSELYEKVKRNEADMLIFNYSKVINGVIMSECAEIGDEIIDRNEALKQMLINEIPGTMCNKLTKTSLFNQNLRFDENISVGEDLLLSMKLCNSASKIQKVSTSYYNYFIRQSSVTNKVTSRVFSIKLAIDEIHNYLSDNGILDEYMNEYTFLKFIHLYFYRVIVGNVDDHIHEVFFQEYDDKRVIKQNQYYKKFKKSCKSDIKVRLFLYEFNYKQARYIHKILIRIYKLFK